MARIKSPGTGPETGELIALEDKDIIMAIINKFHCLKGTKINKDIMKEEMEIYAN